MRFLILVFLYLLSSNQSFAKTGKGEVKLNKNTMEYLIMYMYGAGNEKYSGDAKRKNDPDVMAVSEDGRSFYYYYCPAEYRAYGCDTNSYIGKVIKLCETYSNGSPCYIFAKKRKIVWKNGGSKVTIKTKDLKSPYVVAKKIQEGGFYDGDISKLKGIDIATGQTNEERNITGETINEDKDSLKNSNNQNLVQELETLSKLYESGSLSKEEFEKAKKKLFNK